MQTTLTVSSLSSQDHPAVAKLFATTHRTHLHLDWHSLDDTLSNPSLICQVARSNQARHKAMACLGILPAGVGAAWIRVAALAGGTLPGLMDRLWDDMSAQLTAFPIGALVNNRWIKHPLQRWGFEQTTTVISLRRRGSLKDAHTSTPGLRLRDATARDLPQVGNVDSAAFAPLWRHDQPAMAMASAAAATFTVAELDGRIVGYQLSTEHGAYGHLARLAVDPALHGKGIGTSLVLDMLRFFDRRGLREITVNTQQDNYASQRLYQRLGFKQTRHQLPVWTLQS